MNAFLVRQDLVDQAGLGPPTSADDFKKYLVTLTKPQQNQFGLAAAGGSLAFFGVGSQSPLLMIFGVPNNWSLDSGGKLTKDFETEQYRAAVGFARDLWAAGVYHPDSRTLSGTTLSTALRGGHTVVASHSFGALIAQWSLQAADDPSARLRGIRNFQNPGAFDYEGFSARSHIYWTASTSAGSIVTVKPGRCGSRFLGAAIWR